jgi:hypothetical protein
LKEDERTEKTSAWAFDPIIKRVNTLESTFETLMHGRNKSGHNRTEAQAIPTK